eukprot:scaffold422560_cov110-Attheya_sp.AAC.1
MEIVFRELREQLETDGWWERDMVQEAKLLGIWVALWPSVPLSPVTAHSLPPLSTFLLALTMTTNAGWFGHDYIHGVDDFAFKLRNFAAAQQTPCLIDQRNGSG